MPNSLNLSSDLGDARRDAATSTVYVLRRLGALYATPEGAAKFLVEAQAICGGRVPVSMIATGEIEELHAAIDAAIGDAAIDDAWRYRLGEKDKMLPIDRIEAGLDL